MENFDPWEVSRRVEAVSDLCQGAGACSKLRVLQGWLFMSQAAPKEGTLLVNPLLRLSTAYYMLRPFFAPRQLSKMAKEVYSEQCLDSSNWTFEDETSSALQGALPGHSQELNHLLHPHLDLPNTMVHVPEIEPGSFSGVAR